MIRRGRGLGGLGGNKSLVLLEGDLGGGRFMWNDLG